VERVDVPGVEENRPVVVQLEPVAPRDERLAARRRIDDAADAPVLAELDTKMRVLEGQAVDGDGSPRIDGTRGRIRRCLDDDELAGRRGDHLVSWNACRVQRYVTGGNERRRPRLDLREVPRRVLVDGRDRRPGQDVVELLEEQELPETVELGARVGPAQDARDEFRVVQELLAPPVQAFDVGLRRVDAAVVLEVQLADDHWPETLLRLERLEELVRRRLPRSRDAL
jgi:hypothetical protein